MIINKDIFITYNNDDACNTISCKVKYMDEILLAVSKAKAYDDLMKANSVVVQDNLTLTGLQVKLNDANRIIENHTAEIIHLTDQLEKSQTIK